MRGGMKAPVRAASLFGSPLSLQSQGGLALSGRKMPRNEHAALKVATVEYLVNFIALTKALSTSIGLNCSSHSRS